MILLSKTLLLPSIVLLIGTIFGANVATNAFAENSLKNISDDPFKNIGGIDDHRFPVGFSDKIRILPYPH